MNAMSTATPLPYITLTHNDRDRLERLLNLVGELVIGRGRLEQRLHMLEQLSQQVLACKGRLVESVHSFEEKHTFTLPSASSGQASTPAQGFTNITDFGSLPAMTKIEFSAP